MTYKCSLFKKYPFEMRKVFQKYKNTKRLILKTKSMLLSSTKNVLFLNAKNTFFQIRKMSFLNTTKCIVFKYEKY